MDVIMVRPWMLSSQNGSKHGRHHVRAMDALFSERNRHGCHHGRVRHTMVKKRVIRPRAEQKRMQAKGALVSHTTKE